MPDRFSDRTVLVTGASRGIGREIAARFAAEGARVIGTATTDKSVQAVETALAAAPVPGCGLPLDLTVPGSIDALFASLEARAAVPDILVNNAGLTRDNLLMRMKDEEWDTVIAANLTAAFALTRRVIRPMVRARFGRIINITSVVGVTGNPGQANYAASKAGVIGFTKSIAREVGSRNITVNAVAPGFIDTDMTRAVAENIKVAMLGQIPLNRFGDVAEVASAVLFLASADAAYITGETLHVNGGMYMS